MMALLLLIICFLVELTNTGHARLERAGKGCKITLPIRYGEVLGSPSLLPSLLIGV